MEGGEEIPLDDEEERKKKTQKGEGRGPAPESGHALELGVGPWRIDQQRRKILPSKLHERGPAAKLTA